MFKPQNNRLLVKPDAPETETASGIILTESKDKPCTGVVVDVLNQDFEPGQRILFSKFGYDEVTIDKELYYVVSVPTILGIF